MIDPQFFDMVGTNTTRAQRKNGWIIWLAVGVICCFIATFWFFGGF